MDALTSILDPSLPLTVTEWDEWGDPLHDPSVYEYMKSYTPYENVRDGVEYPKILAVTSLNDTRVLYVEPAKWVARLREVGPPAGAPAALIAAIAARVEARAAASAFAQTPENTSPFNSSFVIKPRITQIASFAGHSCHHVNMGARVLRPRRTPGSMPVCGTRRRHAHA